MPTLTPTTEALRVTQAVHALALMAQGKSQKEACEEAGLSTSQLRYWLGKEQAAIEQIRDMTIELERASLATIIMTRANILRRIGDIIAETPLPAKDLVLVDQHLQKLQAELETKYGTQAQDAGAADFLLNGPALSKPESVFSAKVTQTTIEISKGTNQPEDDIIDGSFVEDEGEDE